jgi:hypothetical protein
MTRNKLQWLDERKRELATPLTFVPEIFIPVPDVSEVDFEVWEREVMATSIGDALRREFSLV